LAEAIRHLRQIEVESWRKKSFREDLLPNFAIQRSVMPGEFVTLPTQPTASDLSF
jgi:hypothetical protein